MRNDVTAPTVHVVQVAQRLPHLCHHAAGLHLCAAFKLARAVGEPFKGECLGVVLEMPVAGAQLSQFRLGDGAGEAAPFSSQIFVRLQQRVEPMVSYTLMHHHARHGLRGGLTLQHADVFAEDDHLAAARVMEALRALHDVPVLRMVVLRAGAALLAIQTLSTIQDEHTIMDGATLRRLLEARLRGGGFLPRYTGALDPPASGGVCTGSFTSGVLVAEAVEELPWVFCRSKKPQ